MGTICSSHRPRKSETVHKPLFLKRDLTSVDVTLCNIKDPEAYSPSALKETQNILQEIFDSEKTYIKGLRKIFELFLWPLWRFRAISKTHLNKFDSIKILLKFHDSFLIQLEQEIKSANEENRWNHLLSLFDDMSPLYKMYMSAYEEIIKTITKLRRRNKTVNKHFNEQPYPIDAFLILPIQRMPRYKLLFSKLLECTPVGNSDHTGVNSIVLKVEEVLTGLNEVRRQHDRALELLQVGSKLKNLNQPFACYDRTLLLETRCWFARGQQQPGYFVLCSDILLFCRDDWSVFVWLSLDMMQSVELQNGSSIRIEKGDPVVVVPDDQDDFVAEVIQSRPRISRRLSVESTKTKEKLWVVYAQSDAEASTWHDLMTKAKLGTYTIQKGTELPSDDESADLDAYLLEGIEAELANASVSHVAVEDEFHRRSKSHVDQKYLLHTRANSRDISRPTSVRDIQRICDISISNENGDITVTTEQQDFDFDGTIAEWGMSGELVLPDKRLLTPVSTDSHVLHLPEAPDSPTDRKSSVSDDDVVISWGGEEAEYDYTQPTVRGGHYSDFWNCPASPI